MIGVEHMSHNHKVYRVSLNLDFFAIDSALKQIIIIAKNVKVGVLYHD